MSILLYAKTEDTDTIPITMPNTGKRFLALGDSYTIGEGLDPSQNWPNQLTQILRADGITIQETHIFAQTGWTTGDLLEALEKEGPEGTYDLVSLLIGVNNQYQGGDLAVFCEEFNTLLGVAIKYAGGSPSQVLVLSIPDWGVTPFAKDHDRNKIRAEIDRFNKIKNLESQTAGVRMIDITRISRLLGDIPSLLAPDRLHFSGEMYAAWVDLVRPVVLRTLHPDDKLSTAPFGLS